MEAAIGQFARVSPLQLWECAPIAKGVGFAMVVVSLIVSIYYNVIMSYAIIYMGASFVGTTSPLPWTSCSKLKQLTYSNRKNISRGITIINKSQMHDNFLMLFFQK